MKTVKIPTDEKELKQFLTNFIDYAKKRGVTVYAICAYSPMVETATAVFPDLYELARRDREDCLRFVELWADMSDKLKAQMREYLNNTPGGKA